jgi:Tol biopolymer transport system component
MKNHSQDVISGGNIMSSKKTFIFISFTAAVFIAAILMAFGFQNSSEHKVLFEKAKFTMETKGDLKGAIKLFSEIIEKYPDEREYAAKSQLYIGLCYEKLGEEQAKQAQQAFQKVVDNYPEQQQEVAIAREKMAALSKAKEKAPPKPIFRKISIPVKLSQGAQLSPDGKMLTFSSMLYEGSMWIVPLPGKVSPDIVGEPSKLAGEDKIWTWGHVWSNDGKWIAYNYMRNEKDIFVDEIHVIPSSGGEPKKILAPVNRGGGFHFSQYCLSLSPDGEILAYASKEIGESGGESKQSFIYTVPVDGGTTRKQTEPQTWLPSFSPDGKKLAYVKVCSQEKEPWLSDLWVTSLSGGKPVQISNLSGRIQDSLWSPNSRMIAFLREPVPDKGCKEVWIVPVSESGKPTAAPTKIDLPLESSWRLAGWMSDNKIGFLLQNPIHRAIYTVPSSGGKATQVTPASTDHPAWSPDGNRLYFFMEGKICWSSAEGGDVSIVPITENLELDWYYPSVSPDGKKIAFPAGEKGTSKAHIWTVSIKGGEPKQITSSPGVDVFPSWSPDGQWIVFSRQQKKSNGKTYKTDLFIVSAEGSKLRQLTFSPDEVEGSNTWSPDGKSIAYGCGPEGAIKIVPFTGGEPKVLVKRKEGGGLSWSPDGQKIGYVRTGKIFVIPFTGGEPVEVNTGMDARIRRIAWSPDGKKIAFDSEKGGDYDLFLMEDFLPLVKKAD